LFVPADHRKAVGGIGSPGWIRTTECLNQTQVAVTLKSCTCGAPIYTKRLQCNQIKGSRIDLHTISAPGNHRLRACGKCVAAQSKSILQFAMLTSTGAPIMWYSAQIWAEFRKFEPEFGAVMNVHQYVRLF